MLWPGRRWVWDHSFPDRLLDNSNFQLWTTEEQQLLATNKALLLFFSFSLFSVYICKQYLDLLPPIIAGLQVTSSHTNHLATISIRSQ